MLVWLHAARQISILSEPSEDAEFLTSSEEPDLRLAVLWLCFAVLSSNDRPKAYYFQNTFPFLIGIIDQGGVVCPG